ncbi:accessory factor UbiK family protein [Sphingomonas lacunae]|uniref:Accessory factor UbiK family protein n=1 Tax=Sphingomonas lacunae TaxID=2698828 RepID=A0A6M4AX53_9SPHN|nr:accessory factor UbiK family protein [Sphingomonas lacunae]QJQ31531.1 accessory factor UbiK family protein [Sphingomonas lacunae]
MQSQNKFFDDLSKALNGAAGTLAGMAKEAGEAARERAREFVGEMDFVSREEFETLKDMLTESRNEVASLKARIEALEGGSTKSTTSKARKKPATKD